MIEIRGRGTPENPPQRFERIARFPEASELGGSAPETVFLADTSRTILSFNKSPDVGFEASINVYRGCEHGCAYCYARPTHEYLGFSAGLDFETKILVKRAAPGLLRQALSARNWKPMPLAMSGVTDPYQPIERALHLTRDCLKVLLEFRNPVAIITKNRGVVRDTDLLSGLARYGSAAVLMSITSLDAALQQKLEPRTSPPMQRLEALRRLSRAGIPTGVMLAPMIPALNDHEIPAILKAAAEAGATFAGMTLLRLPLSLASLFEAWLQRHFPEKEARVLSRIRAMRGGKLNDPRFFSRMEGRGAYAQEIRDLFALSCRRAGIKEGMPMLSARHFRPSPSKQMSLFS